MSDRNWKLDKAVLTALHPLLSTLEPRDADPIRALILTILYRENERLRTANDTIAQLRQDLEDQADITEELRDELADALRVRSN